LSQSSDIMYIALVVIYLAAVVWYIISTLVNRKKGSESSSGSSQSQPKRRSRRGKRCPSCKQIIDNRRTICQHCGHEFAIDPNSEPHPDEIRTGRRKPVQPADASTAPQ